VKLSDAGVAGKEQSALNPMTIRKALPDEVFEKSLGKSLLYMAFDYAMCGAAFYLIWTLCHSVHWSTLPSWQKGIASFVYWNISGFFMSCLFVVGHDCGHGTFSNNETLNDIIGHAVHGSILVPYWPWQLSHRRHHMYHNHLHKDYSHPWYTQEKLNWPDEHLARYVETNTWIRFMFPIVGWPTYLFGKPDGCHFIPFKAHRLWRESVPVESIKCVVSALVVVAYITAISWCFSFNMADVAYYYIIPLLVFGWWLTTVTYLQHHGPETLVYDDSNWNFVRAAFETIDRTFGFGIDTLHHHITDGHVVHHLFFTKIPHYNLKKATIALKKYMSENGIIDLYQHEITYDFPYRVHQYFVKFGYSSTMSTAAIELKKTK